MPHRQFWLSWELTDATPCGRVEMAEAGQTRQARKERK